MWVKLFWWSRGWWLRFVPGFWRRSWRYYFAFIALVSRENEREREIKQRFRVVFELYSFRSRCAEFSRIRTRAGRTRCIRLTALILFSVSMSTTRAYSATLPKRTLFSCNPYRPVVWPPFTIATSTKEFQPSVNRARSQKVQVYYYFVFRASKPGEFRLSGKRNIKHELEHVETRPENDIGKRRWSDERRERNVIGTYDSDYIGRTACSRLSKRTSNYACTQSLRKGIINAVISHYGCCSE